MMYDAVMCYTFGEEVVNRARGDTPREKNPPVATGRILLYFTKAA